jgi:hypothetical protein
MINYHLRKGNIVEYKPNYIFIKPYYISLRDIVEPKDTILEYKHFSDWWESENEVYDSKYINHLINKGYIQEHKPEANHLTFESYLQLLGTDANNASAVNIWKALKYNGYVISKPVIAVDDPPVEKETEEIPY